MVIAGAVWVGLSKSSTHADILESICSALNGIVALEIVLIIYDLCFDTTGDHSLIATSLPTHDAALTVFVVLPNANDAPDICHLCQSKVSLTS